MEFVQTFTGKGLSHVGVYSIIVLTVTSPPIRRAIHEGEQNDDDANNSDTTIDITNYRANRFGRGGHGR